MKRVIKENAIFIVIILLISIYYLYRMYFITPWYDEIYTYINFIDKGFIYSATHWPLPNNHIFFSMLSSIFSIGGIYIGLRGVSLLAAIGTIILLYCFMKDIFSKNIATVLCLGYSTFILTNSLAVQGRGYSLATFFLMLAICCSYRICCKEAGRAEYVIWCISLWFGLYTLVTSVYWVVAICLCSGIILLIVKKYGELLKLVLSSVIAAVMTLLSYAIMWFSIGAQQISTDVTTGYYGADIWFLIKEFPRTCLMRGIEFMTSDSNVQGIEREAFLRDFKYFARDILRSFFGEPNMWYYYCLVGAVVITLVIFIICVIRKKVDGKYLYILALSSIGFLGIYLTLLIQSSYPFTRVFSFLGIFLIMLFSILLGAVVKAVTRLIKQEVIVRFAFVIPIICMIISAFVLTDVRHMNEYDCSDY